MNALKVRGCLMSCVIVSILISNLICVNIGQLRCTQLLHDLVVMKHISSKQFNHLYDTIISKN